MNNDFFSQYFSYVEDTECPKFYHRWCALSGVAALLGRDYFLQHGHFTLNPNMYTMLIGVPGTRKSTAIKLMKKVLTVAGYENFSADKTSKEKFLLDLHEQLEEEGDISSLMDSNLWGDDDASSKAPAEMYVAADEFNDFIGSGNIEFISLLGSLWDYEGTYTSKIKNGKSVSIPNPTINILGGNTSAGFSIAFPTEILGQGFFSRLLLIYGEPTGRKITFPKQPSPEERNALATYMRAIKDTCRGAAVLSQKAETLLDKIYTQWTSLDDVRFENYSNRRFTHLLKLCLIVSAARLSKEVSEEDVIHANTVLAHTEHLMPKALGEFGKSRYSDVSQKIITILERATKPVPATQLIKEIHSDVDNMQIGMEIIKGLQIADKIFVVNGGYMAKKRKQKEMDSELFNASILTEEERNY